MDEKMENNDKIKLYNIDKLKKRDISIIFGVTEKTVFNWVKYGCPRNEDDSFTLKTVIGWKLADIQNEAMDEDKLAIEKRKMLKQIRKLELEIEDKELKTISREKFENIQREQAKEMKAFVTEGYKRNIQTMMAKLGIGADKIDKFTEIWDDFIKQMMDAFVKGGKEIK